MAWTEEDLAQLQRQSASGRKPRTRARIGDEQRFFVHFTPKSLNAMLNSHWTKYSKEKKKLEGLIVAEILRSKVRPITPGKRPQFVFKWHVPNAQKDPDNVRVCIKYVLDALVTSQIIPTDGWRYIVGKKGESRSPFQDIFVDVPKGKRIGVEVSLWEE